MSDPTTSDAIKDLITQGDKMFSSRGRIMSLCQEMAEHFYPEAADFTATRLPGDVFADHLFACDPILMRRQLGDAYSYLRAKNREWYEMMAEGDDLDDDQAAQVWFDMATQTQRNAMYDPVALFDRAMKAGEHFYAAFGNCVLSCELNARGTALRYNHHHFKDNAWCENADGRVDNNHRNFKMTARQISKFFTAAGDVIPECVQEALDKKEFHKEFNLRHVMMPAADWEFTTKRPRPAGADWVSIYVLLDEKKLIREAVSFEFRYVIGRWAPQLGSAYGLSPAAITALPEARMLQALARIIQEAGEKSVDPPMMMHEKAIRGDVQLYAGGSTWVDRTYDGELKDAIQPIFLGKDPRLGVDLLMRSKMLLEQAWFVNQLQLPAAGPEMTAYQVSQIIEQHIRANVPLFEPAEAEIYQPILNLTASILLRVGAFGDPRQIPESLQGRDITFRFSNPLQDAVEKQKVLMFQGMTQLYAMGSAIDPNIKADLDVRKSFRDAVRGSGAPPDWLTDKDEADEAVEQMQQAQALQQMAAQAGGAGAAAEAVGKGVQSLTADPNQKQAA